MASTRVSCGATRVPRSSSTTTRRPTPASNCAAWGSSRPRTGALRRLAVRYLGERAGHAYADAATWAGVVLRLEPGDLRVWDFVDEYGEHGKPPPAAQSSQ